VGKVKKVTLSAEQGTQAIVGKTFSKSGGISARVRTGARFSKVVSKSGGIAATVRAGAKMRWARLFRLPGRALSSQPATRALAVFKAPPRRADDPHPHDGGNEYVGLPAVLASVALAIILVALRPRRR
jgi:hypothetical protein